MERLFYAPDIAAVPELPEDESIHCTRVLRLKKGDPVTVTDGKGCFYSAVIENIQSKHCRISITERWEQKPLRNYAVHIAVSPTKNMERMEWFVEKATEIGIDTITFLHCHRSERKEIKLQRLIKTAVSAMKQSNKATLPKINEMVGFQEFISFDHKGYKMIAHCVDDCNQLISHVYTPDCDALILIGPEGDFSRDEINAALSAGFTPISLGESRLRTDTAALIACHTIHLLNSPFEGGQGDVSSPFEGGQ